MCINLSNFIISESYIISLRNISYNEDTMLPCVKINSQEEKTTIKNQQLIY